MLSKKKKSFVFFNWQSNMSASDVDCELTSDDMTYCVAQIINSVIADKCLLSYCILVPTDIGQVSHPASRLS